MKRRTLMFGSVLVASVMALSACSFGETEKPATESSTLRVANPRPVTALNPFGPSSADLPTLAVTQQVFETLVTRKDGKIAPSLAKSWTNPDPLTWDFTLEDDVTFADGTAFGADDAKASLEQLIANKGPLVSVWAAVDGIEAVRDTEFRIHTSTPLGTLISNLALLSIAPSEKVADDAFFAAPYGTGPFVVDSFKPSQTVVLKRNDAYRGKAPTLKEIHYDYIPEVSGRVTALENNEIDATWGLPADQLAGLKANDDLTVTSYPTYGGYYIWFNSSREPFTDPRVRQAMWYALDMKAIAKSLFGDAGKIATGPLPDDVFGAAAQSPYEYNPEKAKQLLADAGYADGFTTSMMWSTGCCTAGDPFAEAMISDWAKVGITVKPERLETAVWLDKLLALDWSAVMNVGSTITGDADFTLARLYLSSAKRTGYSNPELDALLLQAREELDQGKREKLYAKAGEIIWRDAVGIFPLNLAGNVALRSNVKGFEPTPNDLPYFANVSLG